MKEIEDLKVSQGNSSTITGVRDGDLADLLARVEQAEGPDRELDCLIECALDLRPPWAARAPEKLVLATFSGFVCLGQDGAGWPVNPYTASLDAALALCERAMAPAKLLDIAGSWSPNEPECWPAWTVRFYPDGVKPDKGNWHAQIGSARTPALALIAAMLKALIASPKDGAAERSTEPRETRK